MPIFNMPASLGGDDQARFGAHHPEVLKAQTGRQSEHTWFAAATAAITGTFGAEAKLEFKALEIAIQEVKVR